MINGQVLDTLTKIMVRFPEDTDYVTQFLTRVKREGIDLRDLKITIATDNDTDDRLRRIEAALLRAYPDQAKLAADNATLTTKVTELEAANRLLTRQLAAKSSKATETARQLKADALKLKKEAEALNVERVTNHPLMKMALNALSYVAATPFKAPMSQQEMFEAMTRAFAGAPAVDVCRRMSMDGVPDSPPEWWRIILRSQQPLPTLAPAQPRRKYVRKKAA